MLLGETQLNCAVLQSAYAQCIAMPLHSLLVLSSSLLSMTLTSQMMCRLTNDKIASLNALAYKHVTTSRLNVKLEKVSLP